MTERRELPYAWSDVKLRLQRDIHRLVAELGIYDRAVAGGLILPRNPTRDDKRPGSFVIWTTGEGVGAWKDYATGESGDVFGLIGYLARPQPERPIDIYWWALDYLGLGRGEVRTKAQARQDEERRARERAAAEAKAFESEAAKAAELLTFWLRLAPFPGTLAETYLREARGIPLDRLGHQPGALRFSPALDHVDQDTGEVTTWPCMVSAMTRGKKLVALHRTWLAPDGGGKAPVAKPKKMIGSTRGAAIRLAPGASGLSPTKAAAARKLDPLLVGEGIETTLSAAVAVPGYRAWAAGSLSLMGRLEWPECASGVVLLQDNDWGEQAKAAFAKAERQWQAQAAGRPVKVARSAVGSDFNDWRGRG